jgi:hypothetical protein
MVIFKNIYRRKKFNYNKLYSQVKYSEKKDISRNARTSGSSSRSTSKSYSRSSSKDTYKKKSDDLSYFSNKQHIFMKRNQSSYRSNKNKNETNSQRQLTSSILSKDSYKKNIGIFFLMFFLNHLKKDFFLNFKPTHIKFNPQLKKILMK